MYNKPYPDVEITPKLGRECEQIQNEWFSLNERPTDQNQ